MYRLVDVSCYVVWLVELARLYGGDSENDSLVSRLLSKRSTFLVIRVAYLISARRLARSFPTPENFDIVVRRFWPHGIQKKLRNGELEGAVGFSTLLMSAFVIAVILISLLL